MGVCLTPFLTTAPPLCKEMKRRADACTQDACKRQIQTPQELTDNLPFTSGHKPIPLPGSPTTYSLVKQTTL